LVGCDNIGVTETEVKAVQVVLNRYGGECHRFKGFETENGITQTYFELEMSKSKALEKYSEILEIPASNIAYLFYSNLNDEKKNYTHVKVKINLNNGKQQEFYYPHEDIETMEKFAPILSDISNQFKSQDYEAFFNDFDRDIARNLNMDQIHSLCSEYDSLYGNAIEIQLQGFTFHDSAADNRALLRLFGIMKRKKKNTPISAYIDRNSKKLVGFGFEY